MCWFIPFVEDKQEYLSPASLLWELVLNLNSHNVNIVDVLVPLIMFTLFFGIPSILIGWLIQCAVVVIRTKKA
jgi:hypothetical protein